jgi:hypothetical protein
LKVVSMGLGDEIHSAWQRGFVQMVASGLAKCPDRRVTGGIALLLWELRRTAR